MVAYAAIDVATLILCGTHSPGPSRAITRLMANTIPRAKHHTIRNAGHMSPLTHSAEVNQVTLQHLLTNSARDDERQPFRSGWTIGQARRTRQCRTLILH